MICDASLMVWACYRTALLVPGYFGSASETSVFGKGEALSLTISSASQTQVTLIKTSPDVYLQKRSSRVMRDLWSANRLNLIRLQLNGNVYGAWQ